MSIKSTIAAVAASPFLLAGAAFAGPYVNVETVSSYTGDDYTGLSTEFQIVIVELLGCPGPSKSSKNTKRRRTSENTVFP